MRQEDKIQTVYTPIEREKRSPRVDTLCTKSEWGMSRSIKAGMGNVDGKALTASNDRVPDFHADIIRLGCWLHVGPELSPIA